MQVLVLKAGGQMADQAGARSIIILFSWSHILSFSSMV